MTRRWAQWATLAVTVLGLGLPVLVARRFFDPADPLQQTLTVLPAPYALAIWAPIDAGFLAFAVWQVLPSQRFNPRAVAVRPWLMLNAVLDAARLLVVSSGHAGWTVPVLATMLVVAVVMQRALRGEQPTPDGAESWLRIPFSLYAGWLTFAVFVHLSTELARLGWDVFGLSDVTWGMIVIVVSSVLGLVLRFRLDDPVYGFALVWAYFAVLVRQQGRPAVALFAGVAAGLFLMSLFVRAEPAVRRASGEGARP